MIFVTLLAFVMIGLLGLAIDGALVASTSQQLQHAADAAALNAVRYVKLETDSGYPNVRAAAMSVALANEAASLTIKLDANASNAANGDIVVGNWDEYTHTFTPGVTAPNAVRVHAARTSSNADGQLSLLFGPIFGTTANDVGVTSTAVLSPPLPATLLILDPARDGALNVNGNNSLDVQVGKIHSNSNYDCGIKVVGNPDIFAARTSVVGGACYPNGSISGGPVVENASVIADPLAGVLPTVSAWNAFKNTMPMPLGSQGQIAASGTYNPGYYPRGLDATSHTSIHLNPGSYLLGDDLKLAGNAFVTGSGVTLFVDKNASVDVSGSGAGMQLTPPAEGLPFAGITFFMHRQTTGKAICSIGGGGLIDIEGIVYVPAGDVKLHGSPGKEIGGIIAFALDLNGLTGYTITGKGVHLTPSGADGAFLVE